MKKIIIIMCLALLALGGYFWYSTQTKQSKQQESVSSKSTKKETKMPHNKILIAYYSQTGNTKAVVDLIHDQVNGTMYQIETEDARPSNYESEVSQNVQEQRNNTLPKLKTIVPNFSSYDTVFIGTPTWNMALPQPVETFLHQYNFSNKTVIPFNTNNTNGGYGSGSTFKQIQQAAKSAKVLEGLSVKGGVEQDGVLLDIKGNRRSNVSSQVLEWLKKIGIK